MSRARNLSVLGSDIGSAAKEDVTTSSTDTTAGRLLKVGDFGVGEAVTYNGNLDDITKTGFYRITTGVSNNPSGTAGNGDMMFVQSFQDDIFIQQYYSYTADKVFFRRRTGTWKSWQEIYHTGNTVGTVSATGTYPNLVPTGAIMESGSNANGEYVKYADGTLLCRHTTITATAPAGGYTATSTFPLPATLITYDNIGVSCSYAATISWTEGLNATAFVIPSTGQAWEVYVNPGNVVQGVLAHLTVIGRWK